MQAAALRGRWGFDCRIGGQRLAARGTVQPHSLSRQYRVRLDYEPAWNPRTWVDDPPLKPREPDGTIPHTYPGPRPCLFYPGDREWDGWMLIANTIVPWLQTWLFFYEVWHATGEWFGGGVAHGPIKDEEVPSR